MVEIVISEPMILTAKQKADDLGVLNNSILNGDGNVIGFLGELMLEKISNCKIVNTYDYDLISDFGETIDVKTKRCSRKPLDNYECSVNKFNDKQKCDYYAFVRVLDNLSRGWFLGLISKDDFMKKSIKKYAGEIDRSNNFLFRSDCLNIPISELFIPEGWDQSSTI